jgi:hypothetical protein
MGIAAFGHFKNQQFTIVTHQSMRALPPEG